MINILSSKVLYQNVTKERLECIEYHIRDEHDTSIDFNGYVLSFILNLL